VDGLIPVVPATTAAALPGDRVASGTVAPFAALLGALREPVAEGAVIASSPEAAGADAVLVAAVPTIAQDRPATPEPGRVGDQPAASDPLLVQALLAATQAQPGVAAAPIAKPAGQGGAAEAPRAASSATPAAEGIAAGKPVPASVPRHGRAVSARAETEAKPMTATETGNAAPAHAPVAARPADPAPMDAREATRPFPYPPAVPDTPAPQRTEAASPVGAPPPILPADPLSPGCVSPQEGMPPRAAAPAPIHQVARLVVALSAGGEDEDRLSVALDPVELGRVEISIERQGGSAQVRVMAERPETLALLQRDQRELDRLLGQSGIGEEGRSLSFGLSPDGGGAGGSDHGSRHRGGAPSPVQRAAEPAIRPILGLIDLAV